MVSFRAGLVDENLATANAIVCHRLAGSRARCVRPCRKAEETEKHRNHTSRLHITLSGRAMERTLDCQTLAAQASSRPQPSLGQGDSYQGMQVRVAGSQIH